MKKILSLIIIGLLWLSTFSMMTPWTAKAQEIVWKTNPTPLPSPMIDHVSIIHNGRVYVIGGRSSHEAGHPGNYLSSVYFGAINPDGTIDSWISTTSLPEGRTQPTCVVWNSLVYVIGGAGPGPSPTERSTVWYAPINPDGTIGNWVSTTSLPDRVRGHMSVVWNGRIYVAGGTNGYGWKNWVIYAEIDLDGSLGSWMSTTSLPLYYGMACPLVYNGIIYLIGGTSTWGGSGLSHREVYYASINPDGTIGAWSTTTPIPDGRAYASAVLIDRDIYVIGGVKDEVDTVHDTVYKATINPDGSVGSWAELQSIPEVRDSHSSIAFDNIIYVIGGETKTEIKDMIFYSFTRAPTKWAVVIGVDEYDDPEAEDTKGAPTNSAMDMYNILVDYMSFPSDPNHTHLLLDEIGDPTDDVTRAMVEEELDWLETVAIPEDIVVLYYAGHGWQSSISGNEYIAMHDTNMYDYEFAAEINEIESENLCVILDISYSGGFIKDGQTYWEGLRGKGGEWSDLAGETPSGRVVLTACAENVTIYDIEDWPVNRDATGLPFGWRRYEMVFTHYLIKGFKGSADSNNDGKVTVEEAFSYARSRWFVRLWQTPMIYDGYPEYEGEGDLFLGD